MLAEHAQRFKPARANTLNAQKLKGTNDDKLSAHASKLGKTRHLTGRGGNVAEAPTVAGAFSGRRLLFGGMF